MKSEKIKETLSLIFFPAFKLLILLLSSSVLLDLARGMLLNTRFTPFQIPALKTAAVLPQIILVILFFIFSKMKSFNKIFKATLISFIVIISLLTLLVYLPVEGSLSVALPESMSQIWGPLISNWPASLLYILSSLLSPTLCSILVWGLIILFTKPTEGLKYFIPLAFVFGLFEFGLSFLKTINIQSEFLIASLIAAVSLMACSLLTFNKAWKNLPNRSTDNDTSAKKSRSSFPFLASGYLLAGCLMAKELLNAAFKYQVKNQMNEPAAYAQFLSTFFASAGYSTLAISVLWAILGSWITIKKGWKSATLIGSCSVVIGGLVYFFTPILTNSPSLINQGFFVGLLSATATALFFPLIQILYTYIPLQKRFCAKILTEMVTLPLLKTLTSLLTFGFLMISSGSFSNVAIYQKSVAMGLLLLLVLASRYLNSKFKALS